MSVEDKLNLAGYSLKEWSLIIMLISLAMVFAFVGVGFVLAILNNPAAITFSGTFDLGQFTAIIIAVAGIAAVLVSQQLTTRNITNAFAQNDKAWIDSDPTIKKTS